MSGHRKWPPQFKKDDLDRYVVERNLRGFIRRLEKSNQELGEELQRCKNKGKPPEGWD